MSSCAVRLAHLRFRSGVRPAGIAGKRGSGRTHRARAPARTASLVVALVVAWVSLAAPRAARSGETIVTVQPLEPATSVWMLSAPHVGRKTCELEGATRVRFIARASHGRHRYAEVEALEGACAGERGHVPWSYLEPEPPADRTP